MIPEPQYYADRPFAFPAFRAFALSADPVSHPGMRAAALRAFDLYMQVAAQGTAFFARAGGAFKTLTPTPVSAGVVATARDWLAGDAFAWPTTLRFNGWAPDPVGRVVPPHFRVEQTAHAALIQIELPPDFPDPVAFSEAFTALLAEAPVTYAAMGYGFYLPAALDSLADNLPRAFARYRCALEFPPENAGRGLLRNQDMAMYRNNPDWQGGIPDIGWRTILGRAYFDRLPDLAAIADIPGARLVRNDRMAVIDAGPAPVWGDVNTGEDVTAFAAVSRALEPVRGDRAQMQNALFGDSRLPPQSDHFEDWLERFG